MSNFNDSEGANVRGVQFMGFLVVFNEDKIAQLVLSGRRMFAQFSKLMTMSFCEILHSDSVKHFLHFLQSF